MTETPRLGLPLLESGQAQKHVTVNEALVRMDAFGGAAVASRSSGPPVSPDEGVLHLVPPGGSADWGGPEHALAAWLNGGWLFAPVEPGRRVWVIDEGREARFDGTEWVGGDAPSALGAATALRVAAIDHVLQAGPSSETVALIPDKAVVIGVTGRVLETLEGAPTWRLGVVGGADRYGSGIGSAAGAWVSGVTGAPLAYYGATALRLEAEAGGAFASGRVRLAVHFFELAPPRLE